MKTEIVRIGNSRGIRIPKPLIEQCGLDGTVELAVENDRLVISPGHCLRQGWLEAFRNARSPKGDELLLEAVAANDFDQKEWTW